jgi:hypothetical protein
MSDKFNALIVEDLEDQQFRLSEMVERIGWNPVVFAQANIARYEIRKSDRVYVAAFVDLGKIVESPKDSSINDYNDGFSVIRDLKIMQPDCLRIIISQEQSSPYFFTDPTLDLHGFFDKRISEYLLQDSLIAWSRGEQIKFPLLIERQSPSSIEYEW